MLLEDLKELKHQMKMATAYETCLCFFLGESSRQG